MILLKQKAYVDVVDLDGLSPMHMLASMEESNDLVIKRMMEALVNFGANVNLQAKDGSTPLHLACSKDRVPNAAYLCSMGINTKIVNNAR
mmetsp:Transcript_11326/g.15515  ORF Transcript_11326/g.15515 Transcript_11326/m.15515 type:complete len:90 (+) Transcript_11326:432-701(+)